MEIPKNLYNTSNSNNNLKNTNTSNSTKNMREVQLIALKLEDVLGKQTPSRFPFYCKVAWRLPEGRIWANLEIATAPSSRPNHNPAAFFSWLCSQEMR